MWGKDEDYDLLFPLSSDEMDDTYLDHKRSSRRPHTCPNPDFDNPHKTSDRIGLATNQKRGGGEPATEKGLLPLPLPAASSSSTTHNFRRSKYQVIIGGLTWWVTDMMIRNLLQEIGISDVVDVCFFENRLNGQSKGYCVVSLKSAASLSLSLTQLRNKELFNHKLIVKPATLKTLAQIDELTASKCNARPQNSSLSNDVAANTAGLPHPHVTNNAPRPIKPASQALASGHKIPSIPRPQTRMPPNYPPPQRSTFMMPPNAQYLESHLPPAPPWNNHLPPNHFPNPQHLYFPHGPMHQQHDNFHQGPSLWPSFDVFSQGPPPPNAPFIPRGPPRPPSNSFGGPCNPNAPLTAFMSAAPPFAAPMPMPHFNPAFFGNNNDGISRASSSSRVPVDHPFNIHATSDEEDGDSQILRKNRNISKCAISRALGFATEGKLETAITSLDAGISLIKKSRLADDERCKIMIKSLEDTICGIEAKCNRTTGGTKGSSETFKRARSCSRSHSKERERFRERKRVRCYEYRCERSRSRSRDKNRKDRDYRERHKEHRHRSRTPNNDED